MHYKFLLLIDSFKNSISSLEIEKTISRQLSGCDYFPISDGGEGFLDSISFIKKCHEHIIEVKSLIGKIVKVKILIDEDKNAYLESSKIVGLGLIENTNIYQRSSYGLGEALEKIDELDVKNLYVGLGGSGVQEVGVGLLEALGVKFYNGTNLLNNLTIDEIDKVDNIDFSAFKKLKYKIHLINDVDNELLGEKGTNATFAKQKGASEKDILRLEKLFNKFVSLVNKNDEYIKKDRIGDGSAGGLGFTFKHLLNATYHQGIDFFLDLIKFDEIKDKYDFIISGEGRLDTQSFHHKVVGGILNKVDKRKLIIICGSSQLKEESEFKIYPLYPNYVDNIELSIMFPKKYIAKAIIDLKRDLKIIQKIDHGFPLFIDENSKILILGSFPSVKSREEKFYYMNPYNRFYKLLAGVYKENFPITLEEKKEMLKKHKIALYDVIEECEIEGSKDSSIINPKVINLKHIMDNYRIEKIILNGQKASSLFKMYFPDYINLANFLPSTSPLNASYSLDKLISIYSNVLLKK